jgi:hypothetical protein
MSEIHASREAAKGKKIMRTWLSNIGMANLQSHKSNSDDLSFFVFSRLRVHQNQELQS